MNECPQVRDMIKKKKGSLPSIKKPKVMGKSLGWQYNMSEQQEWEGEKSQEFIDRLSRMSAEVKQQLKGGLAHLAR